MMPGNRQASHARLTEESNKFCGVFIQRRETGCVEMTSGGALHGTGAQKAVGQIRASYASALRSSRPVAWCTVRTLNTITEMPSLLCASSCVVLCQDGPEREPNESNGARLCRADPVFQAESTSLAGVFVLELY